MKWFTGIKTVMELRQNYKELLKKYHPDNQCHLDNGVARWMLFNGL